MWGEKQDLFGEKMLQEGWNQNPIHAIIDTGEKNIFIMHGNGGVLLGDTGSSSQADSPMGEKSNLRIPSLNETFIQNAKDVGTPDTKLSWSSFIM